MKAGILTAYISRHAGGLFWSVRALAQGLQANGCDIRVFAAEDMYAHEDKIHWESVPVSLFPVVGPAVFGYQRGLTSVLDKAKLDLVHVHSIWMYPSFASLHWGRRHGKPYIVSPRGALDPWALSNAVWKKKIARALYEDAHLERAKCIHALCESEYESIRALGLRNPVALIPNGIELPELGSNNSVPDWNALLPSGSKVLLFVSRIHPKKGLVNLLKSWAQVKSMPGSESEAWQLVIGGWDQGGHQAELEEMCAGLDISSTVHFVGPLFNAAKDASLRRADAFILPSFSEGLPMAVLDAWSYALPVLMTPQCNLPEGFLSGAAIRIETNVDSLCRGLLELFGLNENERIAIGQRGLGLVEGSFTWSRIAAQMYDVYDWMLGGGAAPGCVRLD